MAPALPVQVAPDPDSPAVPVDPVAPAVLVRTGQVVLATRATGMADMVLAVMSPVAPVVMVLAGQVNRVVLEDRAPPVSPAVLDRADQASLVGMNRGTRVLNPDPALLHLMPTAPDRARLDPIPADPDPDPMQVHPDPMPAADRRWEQTVRAVATRREAPVRPADRTLRPEVTPQAGATRPDEVADPKPLSTQVTVLAKGERHRFVSVSAVGQRHRSKTVELRAVSGLKRWVN